MKGTFSAIAASALLALVLLIPLHADAADNLVFTKHFKETLFDVTKNAAYSVEVLLDDSEYDIGKDVVGLVIHDAMDKDVERAAISFALTDLNTGQPIEEEALVLRETGGGLYVVEGLDLKREGRWKLALTVSKDGVEDSVEFLFPDVLNKKWPAGRYNP